MRVLGCVSGWVCKRELRLVLPLESVRCASLIFRYANALLWKVNALISVLSAFSAVRLTLLGDMGKTSHQLFLCCKSVNVVQLIKWLDHQED